MTIIQKQVCSAALFALGMLGAAGTACAAGLGEADARRFLNQTSFGPSDATVSALVGGTKATWLQQQFTLPASDYSGFAYLDPNSNIGCPTGAPTTCFRDNYTLLPLQRQFFVNALHGPDQLRQRVALALSEILVTSGQQIRQPYAMANYQRIFLANAFGNFRDVLHAVTLSPAMGNYLNMANNDKPNPARGTQPNENYGREVLQLFSIGLVQLNADGTPKLDAHGVPLPSYDQDVVEGFAHAFTGWTYAPRPGVTSKFTNPQNFDGEMVVFAAHHDTGAKTLLGGTVLPANQSAGADLEAAIDSIFKHPNVGPYIGRQLIQQLVTSNPSPGYVARVSAAFNGQGGGVRGDMKAVISAVLLDQEAAYPQTPATFGKLREPVLQLTHLFRSLGGQSDGVWLAAQASALGEPVFSPPTVFSFYPPDYALPDDPGVQGPAFGVYNASAAFVLSGVMATALNGTGVAADTTVPGATGSKIDLSYWQGLAAKPATLASEINRVLFDGGMSAKLLQSVTAAAGTQPASNPLARARAALFLAVMSPEYLVEH
jgi:uncharacterized protein (DUF1800 family)